MMVTVAICGGVCAGKLLAEKAPPPREVRRAAGKIKQPIQDMMKKLEAVETSGTYLTGKIILVVPISLAKYYVTRNPYDLAPAVMQLAPSLVGFCAPAANAVLSFCAQSLPESMALSDESKAQLRMTVQNAASCAFWVLRTYNLVTRPHVVVASTVAGCTVIFACESMGLENANYIAVPTLIFQKMAENQAIKHVKRQEARRAKQEKPESSTAPADTPPASSTAHAAASISRNDVQEMLRDKFPDGSDVSVDSAELPDELNIKKLRMSGAPEVVFKDGAWVAKIRVRCEYRFKWWRKHWWMPIPVWENHTCKAEVSVPIVSGPANAAQVVQLGQPKLDWLKKPQGLMCTLGTQFKKSIVPHLHSSVEDFNKDFIRKCKK
jgi:hypothetical protein